MSKVDFFILLLYLTGILILNFSTNYEMKKSNEMITKNLSTISVDKNMSNSPKSSKEQGKGEKYGI